MPNKDWCYKGVSIDIIRHLQKKLNFKYEFIESPDGKFGNEVNGVWNGLISEISGKVWINQSLKTYHQNSQRVQVKKVTIIS